MAGPARPPLVSIVGCAEDVSSGVAAPTSVEVSLRLGNISKLIDPICFLFCFVKRIILVTALIDDIL